MTNDQLKQRAVSEAVEVLKQNQNQTLNHDQIGNYLNLQYFSKDVIIIFC